MIPDFVVIGGTVTVVIVNTFLIDVAVVTAVVAVLLLQLLQQLKREFVFIPLMNLTRSCLKTTYTNHNNMGSVSWGPWIH